MHSTGFKVLYKVQSFIQGSKVSVDWFLSHLGQLPAASGTVHECCWLVSELVMH